jgi:hypothetical protein
MKKVLMTIPYFFLWVLYFILTMEKRNEYMMAQSKGYKCTGSKDTSWFLPGSERTYYFDPTKKPEREYLTWKEFWIARGYYNKKDNG